MRIDVSPSVRELAALFPVPLYAVGGYVRDTLLGFPSHDLDLTSPLLPDEVKSLLSGTKFLVKDGSKKLLTLVICDGENRYEYTTFRTDSYKDAHRPEEVTPCSDINLDARRRDFTVNAIYYDIRNDVVVDPLNGLKDLKNKTLRATRSPHEVFGEDGLRLMRLARFAASLDFIPTEETLSAAKENADLIRYISPERIRDELDRILVCDLPYGVRGAQRRGLEILYEIGVLERILPEITLGVGMKQRADFHAYDVFGHILSTVEHADPEVRLAALMHDVAKPKCKIETGFYRGHDVEGGVLTRRILTRLRYSKEVTEETARLTEEHMFNLDDDVRVNTLRLFILKNYRLIDKLVKLKYADYYGSGTAPAKRLPAADRIADEYAKMQKEGVPFSVKDLLVKGEDLLAMPLLPPERRADALNALLRECALEGSPLPHDKEKQLAFIEKTSRRNVWITT